MCLPRHFISKSTRDYDYSHDNIIPIDQIQIWQGKKRGKNPAWRKTTKFAPLKSRIFLLLSVFRNGKNILRFMAIHDQLSERKNPLGDIRGAWVVK